MASAFYLDIGGKLFKTTKSTLNNIPYFSSYFDRWECEDNCQEKPLFIDQDGDDFEHILKWARNVGVYKIPNDVHVEAWGFDESVKQNDEVKKVSQILCKKCGHPYDPTNPSGCKVHHIISSILNSGHSQCLICKYCGIISKGYTTNAHVMNTYKDECIHELLKI